MMTEEAMIWWFSVVNSIEICMWVKYDLIDKRHKIKYKYGIYYGIKIDSIDNRLHPVC